MAAPRRRPLKNGDFIAEPTASPSPAMRHVLRNLLLGREPWVHIVGRSLHGGASGTHKAMLNRGWITLSDTELTPIGAKVAADVVQLATLDATTLDGLIQTHPNMHVVELLRAERARRHTV